MLCNSITFLLILERLLRKCPCSIRIQENTDQKKLHIWTLFTQWFFSQLFQTFLKNIFSAKYFGLHLPIRLDCPCDNPELRYNFWKHLLENFPRWLLLQKLLRKDTAACFWYYLRKPWYIFTNIFPLLRNPIGFSSSWDFNENNISFHEVFSSFLF